MTTKKTEKEKEDLELKKMLKQLKIDQRKFQQRLHKKKYGSPLPPHRTGETIPTHVITEDGRSVYNPDKGSLKIGDKVYPRGVIKKSEGGSAKKKKYQRGGFEQGFRAREDESLGMRTGPERAKLQDMAARRADSYGAWGRRPNQMINRDEGGGTPPPGGRPTASISNRDMNFLEGLLGAAGEGTFREALKEAFNKLNKKTGRERLANSISNRDVQFLKDAYEEKDTPKHRGTGPKNAKGGVASFARGGVERAGEEGSRLSVSMEKQEDAGFSPSEADFREQHKLALEGVMDVGADVTIVQGHNSREQLGETDGVRGGGAAIRGKNFRGVN